MLKQIKIDTNLDDLRRTFGDLVEKQIPFATALALTRTAAAAAKAVKADLGKHFTIRRAYVARGIKSLPATKYDLQASVGSEHPFMALQEEGGEKPKGSRMMAVPVAKSEGGGPRGPGGRGVLTQSKWPSRIKKAFVLKTKHGPVIAQRYGREKKKREKGRRAMRIVYGLERSVKVPPRWGLAGFVEGFAVSAFVLIFRVAYEDAIANADRTLRSGQGGKGRALHNFNR